MNTNTLLNAADAAVIRKLLNVWDPRSGVPPNARPAVEHLLASSGVSENSAILEHQVGLHDVVTLVNPRDPSDWYRMVVVEPASADLDRDHISFCHPMCLAVLGRRLDDEVEWDTGHGVRCMRIASLDKVGIAVV